MAERDGASPLFEAAEAAAIVGGGLVGAGTAPIASVVVDSRKAGPGSLFAALPGERVDGHDFAAAALDRGATAILALGARRAELEARLGGRLGSAALILVQDCLAALQGLAKAYRRRFPGLTRIGITGSSGKTTTKECAAAVLGRSRSIVLNPGNLNSDIGLSLSVFDIRPAHEAAVFEMGTNRRGEMGELAEIFEPDIALITNVGTAHIGIFGSRRAIAEEKKLVFSRFSGRQTGLVWEDDDFNAFLKDGARGAMRDFGPRSTGGFRGARDLGLDGWAVDWEGPGFRFALPGRHNLANAIAAMAIAECAGTPPRDVAEGLASVAPLFGRSEVLRGELTIVRDCYNANPDSAEAAIRLCDSLEWRGRRAYVLGSMLELGGESEAAHRSLGSRAAASSADALFFFGEEARPAYEAAREAGFLGRLAFETGIDRLLAALRDYLRPGDLVLLKGSRGVALERVAEALAPVAGREG